MLFSPLPLGYEAGSYIEIGREDSDEVRSILHLFRCLGLRVDVLTIHESIVLSARALVQRPILLPGVPHGFA
jgi:hypothetical protein